MKILVAFMWFMRQPMLDTYCTTRGLSVRVVYYRSILHPTIGDTQTCVRTFPPFDDGVDHPKCLMIVPTAQETRISQSGDAATEETYRHRIHSVSIVRSGTITALRPL